VKKTDPKVHFKHFITHHKIFVKLRGGNRADISKKQNIKWIHPKTLKNFGVSSVVLKAFEHWEEK
jgi:hypothetical protein